MNPEVLTARKLYLWLWLSPLLTIPTLLVIFLYIQPGFALICGGSYSLCEWDTASQVDAVIAILVSALWHLILLVPTLDKHSEFVRWHGRQALLMAGVRTAIPLSLWFIDFSDGVYGEYVLWSIPILIVVWLAGTLWGQNQAKRGDCALMRWTGHGAALPVPIGMAGPVAAPADEEPADLVAASLNTIRFSRDPIEQKQALQAVRASLLFGGSGLPPQDPALSSQLEALLEIIRFSSNQEQRREALLQLEKFGMVERLE